MNSIDFSHDKLNEWALGPEFFNTGKFPQATYVGTLMHLVKGAPTQVSGNLTLHGVTKTVVLKINSFAFATFKRYNFGLDSGKTCGFKMDVVLRIQVEAVKHE